MRRAEPKALLIFAQRLYAARRTISDVDGSIQYIPAKSWEAHACEGDNCPPDGEQQTWHASVYDPSSEQEVAMKLNFTGVAIDIYLTLPSTGDSPSLTRCNFTIDGEQVRAEGGAASASFSQAAYSSEMQYSQLVYTSASLENIEHELTISAYGKQGLYIGFSHVIVTHNDPDIYATGVSTFPGVQVKPSSSPDHSQSRSTGAGQHRTAIIIGLSITCLLLLLLTSLLTLYFIRRRRRRLRADRETTKHTESQSVKDPTPAYLNAQPSLPSILSFNAISVAPSTSLTSDFSYFDRYLSEAGSSASVWSGPDLISSTRAVSARPGPAGRAVPSSDRTSKTGPPSSTRTLSSRTRCVLSRSATIMTGSSSSKRCADGGDLGFERLNEQGVAAEQSSEKP
ncbi:uncharacterized protein SCHCODRAFT_02542544 [Schizophyllum commune H4-8]|nr:uncharacterized protein SCHCODRAFT_02542544 [Schizophyllum commune H4-8]KAI5892581.1 hypothetical protein SCHCODRAFT_02542544 [Schizophyllum commune H4-8]